MCHAARLYAVSLAALVAIALGARAAAETVPYAVDRQGSRVTIDVGKAGMFSFAGHTHEVVAPALSGEVQFDAAQPERSSIRLEFNAAALRVTGEGEPAGDVPEVQRVMESEKVLDVAHYPVIGFVSRRVVVAARTAGDLRLGITGDLTLHGVSRPLAVPVTLSVRGDVLLAEGRAVVKQSDFGIEPVTAAAGTVKVKDAVTVRFSIVARRAFTGELPPPLGSRRTTDRRVPPDS